MRRCKKRDRVFRTGVAAPNFEAMAQTSQLQFLDEPASTIHTSRSVKRPAFFATLPVFLCEDPVLVASVCGKGALTIALNRSCC